MTTPDHEAISSHLSALTNAVQSLSAKAAGLIDSDMIVVSKKRLTDLTKSLADLVKAAEVNPTVQSARSLPVREPTPIYDSPAQNVAATTPIYTAPMATHQAHETHQTKAAHKK